MKLAAPSHGPVAQGSACNMGNTPLSSFPMLPPTRRQSAEANGSKAGEAKKQTNGRPLSAVAESKAAISQAGFSAAESLSAFSFFISRQASRNTSNSTPANTFRSTARWITEQYGAAIPEGSSRK